MRKKQIITSFKDLKDLKNSFDFLFNFKKYKLRTLDEVKKSKHGRYLKVNNNLFIKLPLLTKKIWITIGITVLAGGSAATVATFYMPHKVTLNSSYLEISKSNNACLAYDYKCTFKIKDNEIQSHYMDNIDVDKLTVKSNGVALPIDAYSFVYQTNAKNELTINKNYIKGNIEITADLTTRTQSHNCFFFEYDIDAYANFTDMEILYPIEAKVGGIEAIDIEKTKTVDDIYLYPNYDMALVYALPSLGINHNIFIVREDNTFKFKIKAIEGKTLPKNIWFRSNARYTKKNEDFFITYSSDYKEAILEVPYFFVRDNGSIRTNPDEET